MAADDIAMIEAAGMGWVWFSWNIPEPTTWGLDIYIRFVLKFKYFRGWFSSEFMC